MRFTEIKNSKMKCKKCADGTPAKYLVHMDAANRDIPLCKQHAIDICTIFDLKVLQKVARKAII